MHNLDLNNSPLERGVAAKRTGCVTPLLRGVPAKQAGCVTPLLRGVPAKQAGCVMHQTVEEFTHYSVIFSKLFLNKNASRTLSGRHSGT